MLHVLSAHWNSEFAFLTEFIWSVSLLWLLLSLLGNWRKTGETDPLVLSCMSAGNSLAPSGQIFVTAYTGES
jgi:hypothetical protein